MRASRCIRKQVYSDCVTSPQVPALLEDDQSSSSEEEEAEDEEEEQQEQSEEALADKKVFNTLYITEAVCPPAETERHVESLASLFIVDYYYCLFFVKLSIKFYFSFFQEKKKMVKEAQREKRKNKVPKHVKKRKEKVSKMKKGK